MSSPGEIAGLVKLNGQGGLNADTIADGNTDRIGTMLREFVTFIFPGAAQPAVIFGKIQFAYDVLVEAVIFNCYAGQPAGGNLVAEVDGPAVAVTATLQPGDGPYLKVVTASTDWVAAGTPISIKFTNVAGVENPVIIIQLGKRVT